MTTTTPEEARREEAVGVFRLERALFFTCPHCDERFAQLEEFDKDIHTGEIYHCGSCGIQVVFQAVAAEDYVPPPSARRDCYFCQPEPCLFS